MSARTQDPPSAHGDPRAGLRLAPLYGVVFMGFVGYSLMITIFTPLLLRDHTPMLPPGASLSQRTVALGVLLSLYPLGQFLGSPVLGSLSDRYGRKPVLAASLIATTLCYGVISFSIGAQKLLLLGAASLLAGLFEGNIVTAQSAIADVIPPAERNRYFGYVYLWVSLAYIIGPLGGGKLADPRLVPWFDEATPFYAVFALLALTTLAVLFVFRETKEADSSLPIRLGGMFASLGRVFSDHGLRRFYGINFLLYLAIFGFFRSYPMFLVDEFHLGAARVSEFIAWVGVPIVLANLWLTGFLTARIRLKTLTLWSAALTGLFMIADALARSTAALWPLLFLTGAAVAVCLPSCATLLSNAAPAVRQGQAMGNNQALQVGAEALSGLAAGLLAALLVKLPLIVLGSVAGIAAMLVAAAI